MTKSPPKHLKRPIPRTGELIPAIGLGTYSVFDVGLSKPERDPLRRVMRLFEESGGGMVDTSLLYGNAESVEGELAADLGVRGSLFLATADNLRAGSGSLPDRRVQEKMADYIDALRGSS